MKEDGTVVINKEIVEAIADRIELEGSDMWWKLDAQDLFPQEVVSVLTLISVLELIQGR